MTKSLKAFLVLLLLLSGASAGPAFGGGRFRYDPDVAGQIVDFDTKEPLSGVVVMAVWTTDVFRLVIEPKTIYYDYFETLSDQNGEFAIPGKGVSFIRKINPPKFRIFKTGYGSMNLDDLGARFRRDSPFKDQVKWTDGRPVILFRKKTVEERKESIQRLRGMPFHEMAIPEMTQDKYRLYLEEAARAYHALGMTPYWESGTRYLQIREGGVYPAGETAVEPVKKKGGGQTTDDR